MTITGLSQARRRGFSGGALGDFVPSPGGFQRLLANPREALDQFARGAWNAEIEPLRFGATRLPNQR